MGPGFRRDDSDDAATGLQAPCPPTLVRACEGGHATLCPPYDFSELTLDTSVNRNYVRPSPRHHEGRLRDRHGTWRGLRWTLWRQVLQRRTKRLQRTAKSCGPG